MRPEHKDSLVERRRMMAVLARSSSRDIDARLRALGEIPDHDEIRRPETGLVMLRGRIAGSGAPFNVGEATVTRAAVRLKSGETGVSYALGRDASKARNAALIDALRLRDDWRARIDDEVLAPLAETLELSDAKTAAEVAATRVDFFTLVRGED
jgi:alpha-D-ribose 1-methylphosphonate 5-triphosphate synthase subunit PhnG